MVITRAQETIPIALIDVIQNAKHGMMTVRLLVKDSYLDLEVDAFVKRRTLPLVHVLMKVLVNTIGTTTSSDHDDIHLSTK